MNMKTISNRATASFLFLVATLGAALAQNSIIVEEDDGGPIRYIVGYKKGSQLYKQHLARAAKAPYPQGDDRNADTMLLQYGRFLPKAYAEVVYLHSEDDVRKYERMKDVEYVQRDTKMKFFAEETPWGIEKVAALSVSDEFVSNRKICIIDSGYDLSHEDLPGAPEVVSGYSGELVSSPWNQDSNGHGTHVAGTILAVGDNDKGVVGVIRNAEANLYIVRVFDDNGFWGSTVAAAADLCADAGSNVINMSLGCTGNGCYSQLEEAVFQRLYDEENILSIAASGNAGTTQYSYPASYGSVVSVGATDSDNAIYSGSQYNDAVDISAPGVDVKSAYPGSAYTTFTGTSMASPHVAGVAALIWSHHPELKNTDIRQALEATALDLGDAGRDDFFGHGLINASAAVEYLNNMTNSATPTYSPSYFPTMDPTTEVPSEAPVIVPTTMRPTTSSPPTMRLTTRSPTTPSPTTPSPTPPSPTTSSPTTPSPTTSPIVRTPIECEQQVPLTVEVTTDSFPYETSWLLIATSTGRIEKMSTEYTRPGTLYRDEFCVPEAQYQFTINDSSGDGICCEYGEGSYTVLYGAGDGATVVAFGGEFGEFDSTTFEVVSSPTPQPSIYNSPTPQPSYSSKNRGAKSAKSGSAKSAKSGGAKSAKSGSAKSEKTSSPTPQPSIHSSAEAEKSGSAKATKRSKAGKTEAVKTKAVKTKPVEKDCEGELCDRKRTREHAHASEAAAAISAKIASGESGM